jgi:hypothetical protein
VIILGTGNLRGVQGLLNGVSGMRPEETLRNMAFNDPDVATGENLRDAWKIRKYNGIILVCFQINDRIL